MGFFSDLKEDLSQAVNELIPEEEETELISQQTAVRPAEPAGTVRAERNAPAVENIPAETIIARENTTVRETEEMITETMTLKDTMTEEPVGGAMADTLESLLEQIDMQEQPATAASLSRSLQPFRFWIILCREGARVRKLR